MTRQLVERELTSEGPKRGESARGKHRSVTVNLSESPIAWLHSRGHLDERQFDAGERLRADYERAQLAPSVTMSWDPVRIKGGGDNGLTPAEKQMSAKRRFDEATAAAGPGLSDVLWRVVCAGETLPDAEKALAWGLVNQVVPAEQLDEIVAAWSSTLADGPTLAYGLTKRAMHKASGLSLDEALSYESQLQEVAGRSEDSREGIRAFVEKREPKFTGR